MKKILLILVYVAGTNFTYCQTVTEVSKEDDERKIFTRSEVAPAFPGGERAFKKFIKDSLNLSIPVTNNAPSGKYTVLLRFVVSKDGTVSDAVCETYQGYGMCEEAIRVIKTKKWLPALQNGRKVYAYHRQSISFKVK